MNPDQVFRAYGEAHIVVILLTIFLPLALALAARRSRSRRIERAVAICLGLLLVTNYLGQAVFLWRFGQVHWTQILPFQLCDWAMVTIIVALFTGKKSW